MYVCPFLFCALPHQLTLIVSCLFPKIHCFTDTPRQAKR